MVKEHNTRIQENFGSFLLTISKLADMTKESQLPLSEIGKIVSVHKENVKSTKENKCKYVEIKFALQNKDKTIAKRIHRKLA